jgi:hypothetical protein
LGVEIQPWDDKFVRNNWFGTIDHTCRNTGVRNNIQIFKSKDGEIKNRLEIICLDSSAWIGTQKYG